MGPSIPEQWQRTQMERVSGRHGGKLEEDSAFEVICSEGPTYRLKHFRGEGVDWEAYREGKHAHGTCAQCGLERIDKHYSATQWAGASSGWDAVYLTCEKGKTSDVPVAPLSPAQLNFAADCCRQQGLHALPRCTS
eukprot:4754182-Amphidinium_carterae.1